jgi:hypothetical protein
VPEKVAKFGADVVLNESPAETAVGITRFGGDAVIVSIPLVAPIPKPILFPLVGGTGATNRGVAPQVGRVPLPYNTPLNVRAFGVSRGGTRGEASQQVLINTFGESRGGTRGGASQQVLINTASAVARGDSHGAATPKVLINAAGATRDGSRGSGVIANVVGEIITKFGADIIISASLNSLDAGITKFGADVIISASLNNLDAGITKFGADVILNASLIEDAVGITRFGADIILSIGPVSGIDPYFQVITLRGR